MINKIKLPKTKSSDPIESMPITEYHFTLPDKTVSIKTLKEVITELGQPDIALFTDGTFTVGRQPILYRKGIDGNWLNLFRFVACQIEKVAAQSFTIGGKVFSTAPFAAKEKVIKE